MTRSEHLQALYDVVKAGMATDFRALLTDSNNPAERAKHCGWASSAYKGNLNSAKQLHDALLPGFHWKIEENDDLGFMARVLCDDWHMAHADTPARAWLLAILEALIAQQGA